jgi:mannitol-1-phosphate 5-dehydrogenase
MTMAEHVFTGFGFGPIQGGLFVKEAFQSGNFRRMVVAEIDQELVDAVRANGGSYYVNVAKADGIDVVKIDNIELLNPNVAGDSRILREVLAESTEIATCLPSVDFYDSGGASSVALLIADGLKNSETKGTIVYTAENNNQAAEILEEVVRKKVSGLPQGRVQFLNTVIGKMSRVVSDFVEIAEANLVPIAPSIDRAFLVEEFNRILVTRAKVSGLQPGITVFIEEDDLLPFEEAKLYGHNAVHALLGFIGAVKGCEKMTELKDDKAVMQIGRGAFLEECGAALTKKCAHLEDEFFAESGFRKYAEDLLERMTNPYLADTVARVCRDVVRKLGVNERIFGTMQLALEHKIEPKNVALGAMAGIVVLLQKAEENNLPGELRFSDWHKLDDAEIEKILTWIWSGEAGRYAERLIEYTQNAKEHLEELTGSGRECS